MRIKTFYAKTMSDALREVKASLGPDALLLSTKEIPRRSGVWGSSSGFEVVAASDSADEIDVFSSSGNAQPAGELALPQVWEGMEVPSMEEMPEVYSCAGIMKSRPASAARSTGKKTGRPQSSAAVVAAASEDEFPFKGRVPQNLYHDLVRSGVDSRLARELLGKAWDSLTAGQRRSRPALLRSMTQAALALCAGPSTQNGMPGKRIVAFVGPTGVGKTTSIAKLAAHLALHRKKKVILMTLDGYRIGAIEQIRTYAGLMGIPFRYVDQVSDLPSAIAENSQRDYILIDTAGRGPRDLAAMNDLASFLRQSEIMERHLVLSAATKPQDMRNIMDQFEICSPDHLLFTKLDETSTPGPILNELVRTRKSFSYYTDGQKVPDDLHAVLKEHIMDIVLNQNNNAFKD